MGAKAIANGEDVSDYDGAGRLIAAARNEWGDLNVIVNNAGILRDRMLANMTIEEWDAVIRVHLRSTFSMSQHASVYWREKAKAGDAVDAHIINTTSPTGLYGNAGQTNYGAAKAGIAMFTMIAAEELGRYGVTVNAISPGARTRMTETIKRRTSSATPVAEGQFDPGDPDNVSPLVVWLATPAAKDVNGRVFNVRGGHISVAEPFVRGPGIDREGRWGVSDLDNQIPGILAKARGKANMSGQIPAATPA
jgi:NAD(P)-dependent dehydrogenase (short-subunit alcohol dehydrogenase family)